MADEKNSTEQRPPLEAEHHDDLQQALNLLKEYAQPIAISVGAALVVFLGVTGYRQIKSSKQERAARLLSAATSVEQLQEIVQDYATTPSAPIAKLNAAARLFHSGQFELARLEYSQFLRDYPDHMMKPAADLGMAYCQEASGETEEALAEFDHFTEANPDHFLTPLAVISSARCLEELGRLEQAQAVYKDFIEKNPETAWAPQVQNSLMYVEKEIRAKK
ncbi:MAG: tetratricopeptide repeat protein [Verrucomicrobia bacterium]|nr:tetratricopeptide repeat protein [Verrucomicrobiota bacterium]